MSASGSPRTPDGHACALGELAAVFLGGAVGALLRVGLGEVRPPEPGTVPWATFLANVVGCALLGAVLSATAKAPGPSGSPARSLLGPGFCGALTTFSAFQVELVELLADGDAGLAVGYAALSLLLGLAAFAAGRRLAA
jgi:CrcB protein